MKRLRPGKLLSMSYWMGMSTAFMVMMAIQDIVGKETYIRALQEHWVEGFTGQWVIWLLIAAVCTSCHVWLRSAINKKSAELEDEGE